MNVTPGPPSLQSVFDVSAVVLEGGGGDTGALVCGASLALADAGVEGLDLVPGCGVVSGGWSGGRVVVWVRGCVGGGGGGKVGAYGGGGGEV